MNAFTSPPASPSPADRDVIAAVQRDILAALRAGRHIRQAHKEGGTNIDWVRDRFVIEEYGEWSSRREYTDETAFLEALWKRYAWMVSPGRGAQRQSEPDAWRSILRELRGEHPSSHLSGSTFLTRLRSIRMIVALLVLVLAVIGFGVVRLVQVRTLGAPFGASVRVGDSLATLVSTQERYIPSLHRNPERDRFRIDVMITPLFSDAKPRMIALARSLRSNAFHPGTKLLGTDGPLLWMFVPELKALDLRTSRVITLADLRAANPGLGEIWTSARFHFADRLHLMSADRQRSYTIDPDTLRAREDETPPRITWQDPAPDVHTHLCQGGPIATGTWLVALSAKERESSFRVGSTIAHDLPAERSREPRQLHRLQVEPLGTRLRIVALEPVGEASFTGGTLLRRAPGAGPLVLGEPTAVLVCHRTGSTLEPRISVARVDAQGAVAWSVDTGLRDLDQVLPDARHTIMVGRFPAPEGRLPEPVAVIVDAATGAVVARSLRP